MKEDLYHQVRNCSFNIAYFMTNNFHDAEDIAQNVCMKFLLNEESVENPLAWSRTVTKNEVYKRQKLNKEKAISVSKEKIESFEKKLADDISLSYSSSKYIKLEDAKDLLSKDDYFCFKIWIKNNFNIAQVAKCQNITYYAAQNRIQRMKKNLKATKLRRMGCMVSKDILDFRTTQNIKYFLKKFIKLCKQIVSTILNITFQKMFSLKSKRLISILLLNLM